MAAAQEKRQKRFATPANANNRVGVYWTEEEEAELKQEFLSGQPLQTIADQHQRAIRAIELRLAKIAAGEVSEETPVTVVCAKYRVTESMVQKELARAVKKAQPKKNELVAKVAALEEEVRQLKAQVNLLTLGQQ